MLWLSWNRFGKGVKMITKQDRYIAAIYCRLSSEDGQAKESGSIETQKALLTQYCKEGGFAIGDYYCDDGWSGIYTDGLLHRAIF